MYGWTPGARPSKTKTYAGVLAEAGRNDVDHKELHYEGEILKKRCLAETAPLSLLLLARYFPEKGIRLRFIASAPAMAHQLLGVPAAPAPARPARAVEMWLADARTGRRMPPALLAQPLAWGHPGVRAETCSTPAARAHGEMTDILDVNFRVMQSSGPPPPPQKTAKKTALPRAQVGFPVHLGNVPADRVQLRYTVDGGEVQTLAVSIHAWAALTGNVATDQLRAATEGQMSAIQNAARALATWTPRPGGDSLPWEDVEPALRALCQPPPPAAEEEEEPSAIIEYLRWQHRAQRQKLLQDMAHKTAAAAHAPPPTAVAPHGCLHRHNSLGVSVDAVGASSIGFMG